MSTDQHVPRWPCTLAGCENVAEHCYVHSAKASEQQERAEKAEARVAYLEANLRRCVEHHQLCEDEDKIREEGARAEATSKAKPLTEEEQKNLDMHHTLALIHGFNEMATRAITLGEKAYYRLARDTYEKKFNELGGKIDRGQEQAPVLVIPGHVPEIRFDARDIELMRACVARHDGEPRLDEALPKSSKGCQGLRERARLTHVAVIDSDGQAWSLPRPFRHHHVLKVMHDLGVKSDREGGDEQGFLDAHGHYLTRKQALVNAHAHNQLIGSKTIGSILTSEDLW